MLQDAAIPAHSVQRSGKAPCVVAFDLADAGARNVHRTTCPHLAPSLTRRVRDDRMRARILAGVPRLVPRVYAVQSVVCAAGLDV
jgi:hypothetical protein